MTDKTEIKINSAGTKRWYQNDKLHRVDGPAVEYPNGTKYWYQNGTLQRTDGPAVEYANGLKEWYQTGLRHRTDGPAIEKSDGRKEYWINGKELTQLEAFVLIKAKCNEKSN
jgi:hypothetical protein